MSDIIDIPLSDLLVDPKNARLSEEQVNQQDAILALTAQQGKRLLKLAADIVENGLDPTTLPAVLTTDDQHKRYIVYEGNRRLTALKALETPGSVSASLLPADRKQLHRLSEKYSANPIISIKCVLFKDEKELNHWVELRHGGQREGIGLVEWGAVEKDRWAARHGQQSPEGQILDFVEKFGTLSAGAKASDVRVITNIKRLIGSPDIRNKLGIEVVGGKVLMKHPGPEVLKGLTYVVDELKLGRINVRNIYTKEARAAFAASLPTSVLPETSSMLPAPVALSAETSKTLDVSPKPVKRQKPKPLHVGRTTLIPRTCQLNVTEPRINAIYVELLGLNVDQFPNASSVSLRVLLELSVHHYVVQNSLLSQYSERDRDYLKLSVRMKAVLEDLKSKGKISSQLEIAMDKVAESQYIISASINNFHQYVHNKYVFPKATELMVAWDELQPLMEKLWP